MRFCFHHGDRPLAGYTILRGIGRGSFSEVYLAVSDGGREVALKAVLDRPEIERRGIGECLNVGHPHLVSIHDLREAADGTPFVVMEHVSGATLRELIAEHPGGLPVDEAYAICRQVASGLAALHERGIVHRDLKPENIFCQDGTVKIGDYGLAKRIGASSRCGHTTGVGTIAYMAPEVMEGRHGPAADLYALGAILHELLTGRTLFTGATHAEVLAKHLAAAPDLDAAPAACRAVIARAVAKRPEERFASAREMAAALVESVPRSPVDLPLPIAASSLSPPGPAATAAAREGRSGALWATCAAAAALVFFLAPLFSPASWERWTRPKSTVSPVVPAIEAPAGWLPGGLVGDLERCLAVERHPGERREEICGASRLAGRVSRAVVRRIAVWIRGGEAEERRGEHSLETVLVEIAGDSSARIAEAVTHRILSRDSTPGR
jgi:hypothetical protein